MWLILINRRCPGLEKVFKKTRRDPDLAKSNAKLQRALWNLFWYFGNINNFSLCKGRNLNSNCPDHQIDHTIHYVHLTIVLWMTCYCKVPYTKTVWTVFSINYKVSGTIKFEAITISTSFPDFKSPPFHAIRCFALSSLLVTQKRISWFQSMEQIRIRKSFFRCDRFQSNEDWKMAIFTSFDCYQNILFQFRNKFKQKMDLYNMLPLSLRQIQQSF